MSSVFPRFIITHGYPLAALGLDLLDVRLKGGRQGVARAHGGAYRLWRKRSSLGRSLQKLNDEYRFSPLIDGGLDHKKYRNDEIILPG